MKIHLIVLTSLFCFASLLRADEINLRRTQTVEVVEKTKDAVVFISTTKLVTQMQNPFGNNDPAFAPFSQPVIVPVGSLGSGFIVHPDGYIITNNHVIDRAYLGKINVELLDGRKFDADLISADADADLAVLRIHADKPLPYLELGDSSDLMIGEPVIAVGNPLGYSHTVSTGIVSALHRDLKGSNDKVLLNDLIQTDAAINPGNSGGPLLNAYGQVIGINTAIRGDAQNIGFAIQIDRLRDLIPQLMDPAHVTKLDMGIKLKEHRELTPPDHVHVTILRGKDDVKVETIAGAKPRDIIDAYALLLKQKAGQSFEIALKDQSPMKIAPQTVVEPAFDANAEAKKHLGISVEPVTPAVAEKYGLQVDYGMMVSEVLKDSIAAQTGLQPGDVIVALGRIPIKTAADFSFCIQAMQKLPPGQQVVIKIYRGENQAVGRLQL